MRKEILNTWLYSKQGLRFAIAATFCMYGLIALLCLQTLWIFVPTSSQETNPHDNLHPSSAHITLRDLSAITEWHLFGQDPSHLPSSQLQLSLIGILAANPMQSAQAIMVTPDGNQAVYVTGDTLPGGAVLYQILPDSVVIKRQGHLESLHLPKPNVILDVPLQGL